MILLLLINMALAQNFDYYYMDEAIHAQDNKDFIKDHKKQIKKEDQSKAIKQYKKDKIKEDQKQEKARLKYIERKEKSVDVDDTPAYQKYLKQKEIDEKKQLQIEKDFAKTKSKKPVNPNLEKNMEYLKNLPSYKRIPKKDRKFKFKDPAPKISQPGYNPLPPTTP